MIRSEFMAAINQICSERGIEPEIVLETLKHAILAAYKKDFGKKEEINAEINPENGEVKILEGEKDITPPGFGRIAAQTAKQVILQGVREAEKEAILKEYQKKIGSITSGMLQRKEGIMWIVDIGRTTAAFPPEEQIANEPYRLNQRLKFLIKEIRDKEGKNEIILSRTEPALITGLFEMEVPEMASGAVEIKVISREPGSRSKIAVNSTQDGVDPVGSCVGQRGIRVQAITNELSGEKLDIISWSEDQKKFVPASLSPAKATGVSIDEKKKQAKVIVPDDQLSLAIGKEGQNVRLAAKLTGYKIDIKGESEAKKPTEKIKKEVTIKIDELEKLGLSSRIIKALRKAGITTKKQLAEKSEDELKKLKGIGEKAIEEIKKAIK